MVSESMGTKNHTSAANVDNVLLGRKPFKNILRTTAVRLLSRVIYVVKNLSGGQVYTNTPWDTK